MAEALNGEEAGFFSACLRFDILGTMVGCVNTNLHICVKSNFNWENAFIRLPVGESCEGSFST